MIDSTGREISLGSLCQQRNDSTSSSRQNAPRERGNAPDYVDSSSSYSNSRGRRYYNDPFEDPSYNNPYDDPISDPTSYNDPFEDLSYNNRYNDFISNPTSGGRYDDPFAR